MTRILETIRRNRECLVIDLILAALCALAFAKGVHTTADLRWPYDLDQFREIGMAQAVLDHRYGTDQLYAGETIWYNPLTSTLMAGLSRLTSVPVHLVVTRAGPYVNLLAPIAFYVLVAYLFNRRVALAAAVAFLFAPIGDAPAWATPSYSPWVFSQSLAQSFFYLGLLTWCRALKANDWGWYLISGAMLGVTFLGHTAPAVILGAIMLFTALKNSIAQSEKRLIFDAKGVRGLVISLCVAFVVGLPFTVSILFHYHLKILNSVPGNWIYPPLTIGELPNLLRGYVSWISLFAGAGVLALIFRKTDRASRPMLLTWVIICCVALTINEIQQLTSPPLHLMFVPAHHFLFYLTAAEYVLFGIGLVFVSDFLAGNLLPKIFGKFAGRADLLRRNEQVLCGVGLIVFLGLVWSAYAHRFDFTTARSHAMGFQERKAYLDAYQWILSNTKPDDVFLSLTGDLDLSIVGPADRKVVVTCQAEFSNPYVDWKSRSDAATRTVDKLAAAAPDALAALRENHVDYLITGPMNFLDDARFSYLAREFAEDNVVIYRVRSATKP